MRVQTITCVLLLCLVCAGCEDTLKGAVLAGAYVITIPDRIAEDRAREADRKWREASSRERYGRSNCPDAFVDICWEFDPEDAASALSAPPPWETYGRIVGHLREQPLPLDDERSRKVYQGVRRGLLQEPLTDRQYAAVLADAAHFIKSPKAGDGVSAAMLLSALTQTLLPARLHLSSPDEWKLAGRVAALLVPAYERALAELADAAKEARLRLDQHGDASALARAELCLASAYEFAAFVEQDPAEKERLFAKAFAVSVRGAEGPNWYYRIMAGMAGGRAAATDGERLELARRLTDAASLELRRTSDRPALYDNMVFINMYYLSFGVKYFLYQDVRPGSAWAPFFRDPSPSNPPKQTPLNLAILEIWERCESADTRRAAVEALVGLYAVGRHAGHTPKGAVAALMLELYGRSGDERWLRAAPGYMRAGGDLLPAGEWKTLAEQARRRRAELVAQLDDPKLCRDADGLVIRRGGSGLITDQAECAGARELIARYPLAAERRSSWLGSEYGTERYIWE
ncbi:MAG: hypothetical protein LBO77_09255 [Desulfovibrio sp.]|jgi:hypothetical protein|nr:hypothetical protein [Desulfovibrio sp.]